MNNIKNNDIMNAEANIAGNQAIRNDQTIEIWEYRNNEKVRHNFHCEVTHCNTRVS